MVDVEKLEFLKRLLKDLNSRLSNVARRIAPIQGGQQLQPNTYDEMLVLEKKIAEVQDAISEVLGLKDD